MSSKSPDKTPVSVPSSEKKTSLKGITIETDYKLYDILQKKGPKIRSELVSITGIARSTLYDALVRLMTNGHVKKWSESLQGPGRPKVFFGIADDSMS